MVGRPGHPRRPPTGVAAGGIADRRGVAAAFALGAEGVVVGTAFLRTQQSAICASYRRAILGTAAHDTVLTTAMSGRLSRGIPNRAMRVAESEPQLPFPAQNWLTGQFRAEAAKRDQADLLSHGQKQWLEIGMLLMQDPELLMLDEPVAGMSVAERKQTADLLNRISANRAVIVIEHDMEFVKNIAHRVTVLHQGKILAEGSMDKVQADPRVIEVYLGH